MALKFGAIVARFQVHKLHEGHIHLIDSVYKKCDEVIIMLGTPSEPNERNILSFEIRKQMILETYPKAFVVKIIDHNEDKIWSQHLDDLLTGFAQSGEVTLFGSRDSFKSFYTGKFPYEHIPEKEGLSGTALREEIINLKDYSIINESFRAGIIHGYNLAIAKQKEKIE
jgi:bifunctional NMN adenylyltransferase/nudix hydrolase